MKMFRLCGLVSLGLSFACTTTPVRDQPAASTVQDTSKLGPAAKMWASQPQPAAMIEFFQGTFGTLAITLTETGESFTVRHSGARFEFLPGVLDDADYKIELQQTNVQNVVTYAADGVVDGTEATRMMAVLFTPLTQSVLNHPVTKDPDLREQSGVEDLIHTYLLDPEGAEVAVHTMRYQDLRWTVSPGAEGEPKRIFRINAREAVEYQRRAHQAIESDNSLGWLSFVSWYKGWREGVSEVPASAL